jgi:hypothetical protein
MSITEQQLKAAQDEGVPLDGSPSQAALDVFTKVVGEPYIEFCGIMLERITPEAMASYGVGQIPEYAYNIMLSAFLQLDANIRKSGYRCIECGPLPNEMHCERCQRLIDQGPPILEHGNPTLK